MLDDGVSRVRDAAARARACRAAAGAAVLVAVTAGSAAGPPASGAEAAAPQLPPVVVSGTTFAPVEKSYRRMMAGLATFERERARLAPGASLRFRLLPRRRGTDMDHVTLEIVGTSFTAPVPLAPDHTFTLVPDARAEAEDAVVATNRRRLSMTWRAEIRTPGWPAGTRRLGDLRLECEVGLAAGLVSNNGPLGRIAELFTTPHGYCDQPETRYLFFAEQPIFGVTLVDGARRESIPTSRLWAGATDDADLAAELPYCDCEVLVDRTFHLPLGDHRWSDETRVEFEPMEPGR